MAIIIDRMINGVPERGIRLGSTSGSVDAAISREMAWGANWKVVRQGILCGISEYPSQSYNRALGLTIGVSSGSRTFCDKGSDRTFFGVSFGEHPVIFGYPNNPFLYKSGAENSGSFFHAQTYLTTYGATGSIALGAGGATEIPIIANMGDARQRKSIFIVEVSQSGNQLLTSVFGIHSSSVIPKNGDLDWSKADLRCALTGSWPTASGIILDKVVGISPITYNTASYLLNSIFINQTGGLPLEIYDWFVYKVA